MSSTFLVINWRLEGKYKNRDIINRKNSGEKKVIFSSNNFLSCCVCRLFFRLNAAEDRITSLILLCFIFIIMFFLGVVPLVKIIITEDKRRRSDESELDIFSKHSITNHLISARLGAWWEATRSRPDPQSSNLPPPTP